MKSKTPLNPPFDKGGKGGSNGYKHTPLGLIPEGWQECNLGKVSKIIMGQSPESNNYNRQGKGIFLIQGGADIKNRKTFPRVWTKTITKICEIGDIIMTVRAPVGAIAKSYHKACIGRGVCAIRAFSIDEGLLYQILLDYEQKWKRIEQGSTFTAITGRDIINLKIVFPINKNEQTQIASTLCIWDKAIAITERLIIAKEKLKKGLMQELLTGKRRFKKFEKDEWKENKLKEFLIPIVRAVDKPRKNFLSLGIRSHCKGTFQKKDFEPSNIALETLYEVKENDLIVNITFAWEGAIALSKKEDDGALVSHRFPTYEFNKLICLPNYFKYIIVQKHFVFLLGSISPGGAGRNRVLDKTDFLKLKAKLPSLDEQRKVSSLLTSIDKEIEILKSQLELYRKQKKGLMQVLLTGKVRVKVN